MEIKTKHKLKCLEGNIGERFGKAGFGSNELRKKLKLTYNRENLKINKSTKSSAGVADVREPTLKCAVIT